MNKQRLAGYVLLAVAFGMTGYCLHSLKGGSPSFLASGRVAPLDCFLPAQSFSEIENAKGMVEALSARYAAELRTRFVQANVASAAEPEREASLGVTIQELERGITEFKGTGQEFRLVEDLLLLIKRKGDYDRWVDTYLGVLYRHPAQDLVGRLAGEALIIAQAAGREPEMLAAFRHVRGIPADFEAKRRVEAAAHSIERDAINWSGNDATVSRNARAVKSNGVSAKPSI